MKKVMYLGVLFSMLLGSHAYAYYYPAGTLNISGNPLESVVVTQYNPGNPQNKFTVPTHIAPNVDTQYSLTLEPNATIQLWFTSFNYPNLGCRYQFQASGNGNLTITPITPNTGSHCNLGSPLPASTEPGNALPNIDLYMYYRVPGF